MSKTAMQHLIDTLELNVLSSKLPWVDKTINEALEMEKQQIIDSWNDAGNDHVKSGQEYFEHWFNYEGDDKL